MPLVCLLTPGYLEECLYHNSPVCWMSSQLYLLLCLVGSLAANIVFVPHGDLVEPIQNSLRTTGDTVLQLEDGLYTLNSALQSVASNSSQSIVIQGANNTVLNILSPADLEGLHSLSLRDLTVSFVADPLGLDCGLSIKNTNLTIERVDFIGSACSISLLCDVSYAAPCFLSGSDLFGNTTVLNSYRGAILTNYYVNSTFTRCHWEGDGAFLLIQSLGDATITDSTFLTRSAILATLFITSQGGRMSVYNSTFSGGSSTAVWLAGGGNHLSLFVYNCTFDSIGSLLSDTFNSNPSVIYINAAVDDVDIRDSTFINNNKPYDLWRWYSGIIFYRGAISNVTVENCSFINNTSPLGCIVGTEDLSRESNPTQNITEIHLRSLSFINNSAPAVLQTTPFASLSIEGVKVHTGPHITSGWAFNLTAGPGWNTRNVILRDIEMAGNEISSDGIILIGSYDNVTFDRMSAVGAGTGRLLYSLSLTRRFILSNTMISHFGADHGGTLFFGGSTGYLTLDNVTIHDSVAVGLGGAILVSTTTSESLSINNVTVTDTFAQFGGAIAVVSVEGMNVTLNDVAVSNASARANGGGIYVTGMGDTNTRVTRGSALYGGGVHIEGTWLRSAVYNGAYSTCSATEGAGMAVMVQSQSFDLTGTFFESCSSQQSGGAISFTTAAFLKNVHIESVYIQNSSAIFGGGIGLFSQGELISMNNVTIHSCASLRGAAIYTNIATTTDLEVHNSLFTTGQSDDSGALYINSAGSVTVSRSNLSNNIANVNGGSMYILGSTSVTLTDLQFINNVAGSNGGALDIVCRSGSLVVEIVRCNFSRNSGQTGGAIYASDVIVVYGKTMRGSELRMNIVDSTFIYNQADRVGAVYFDANNGTFRDEGSEWEGNTAGLYGAAFVRTFSNSSSIVYDSSSFNNNTASSGGVYVAGTPSRFEMNHCNMSNHDAENNGGALFISELPNNTYIYNSRFAYNTANKGGGAVQASSRGHATLWIYNSVCEHNSAASGGCMFLHGLREFRLNGTDVSAFRFSGIVNVMDVNQSTFSNNSCSDSGSVFQLSSTSTISLSSSSFSANSAGNQGGAVAVYNAISASIYNTTFDSNDALHGGALFIRGARDINVTNNIWRGNRAITNGGGLYVDVSTEQKRQQTTTQIVRNRFSQNVAVNGGALYVLSSSSTPVVDGGVFTGNEAQYGGAIAVNGTVNIANYGTALAAFSTGIITFSNNRLNGHTTWLADSTSIRMVGATSSSVVCNSGNPDIQGSTYTCREKTETAALLSPGAIFGIVAATAVVLLIIAIIITVFVLRRQNARRQKKNFTINLNTLDLGNAKKVVIDYSEFKGMCEIGYGGFGVVYSGEWRGAKVAIKQLLSQTVSREQLEEFIKEVSLLQSLRPHPNLVMFIGTTIPPDPLSLVTEFCECGSLDTYLKKFPYTEFDILVNDLAARNILLNASLVAKVSDFGLSRQVSNEEGNKTQSNIGPLKWMAPEALTQRVYSPKSDVYSFGIMIWEIMFKSEPYPELSALQAALCVSNEDLRPIIPDSFNPDMTKLMRRCWSQNPEDRPPFVQIVAWLTGKTQTLDETLLEDTHHSIDRQVNAEITDTAYTSLPLGNDSITSERV
ncbi:adhesin-like protein [Planoprotostelium fungivorum]|uniref:Adhesin-like protein n=1 Tax=Planoprotostelium fungivorum TaxID=1890364 RepID=A0A2P6MSK2_9EUKA|nr:adhesin-like protein [Planoprotostelium fungivorum]